MGEAKGVVDNFYELFAAGKIVDATALFDPACITLMPSGPLNQAEHEGMGPAFKAGLPNSHMVLDKVVAVRAGCGRAQGDLGTTRE